MRQILKKPSARKELRFAIRYDSKFDKVDQRAYLSAMFDPDAAYKKVYRKKNKSSVIGSFARSLQSAHINKAFWNGTNASQKLVSFLKEQHIALYFPYREKWKNKDLVPTITYHPLDNEVENEGWKPTKTKTSANKNWKKVKVNDQYALNNPTMIVEPCDAGPHTDPCVNPNNIQPCPNGGCGGGGGGGWKWRRR